MPHFDWTQWGIAGAVIGVLFFILWRMLIWVMQWVDKQAEQHQKERTDWQIIMTGIKLSIDLHNQSSIEARRQNAEAHNFQREEHKEMIKVLGRINGFKE